MRVISEKKGSWLTPTIIVIVILGLFYYFASNSEQVKDGIKSWLGYSHDKIKNTVEEIIIENPDMIISAFEKGQKKKQAEAASKIAEKVQERANSLKDADFAPVSGNPQASVVISYSYDYNCSYCKKGENVLKELLAKDSDVLVYYSPVAMLGKASEDVTKVGIAVYFIDKAKFQPYYAAMMSRAQQSGLDDAKKAAKDLGIDAVTLDNYLAKQEVLDAMKSLDAYAHDINLAGVPQFVINGEIVRGLVSYTDLDVIVKAVRAKKTGSIIEKKTTIEEKK